MNTPPLRPPTEVPSATDDPWSSMYDIAGALEDRAIATTKESLVAAEAGDRAGARQLVADAEALFRLADRITITMTMKDDETRVVSDPAVYAARYGVADENPTAVSRLLELVTKNLEREAHFGSDR